MADIYLSTKKEKPAPPPAAKQPPSQPISAAPAKKSVKPKINSWTALNKIVGRRRGSLISAFVARPKGINFESQGEKEKIILLLRRHWITNLRWIFSAIGLILAPAVLSVFPLLASFPVQLQAKALVLWYLLVLAFIIQQALSWFFNVGIVTNKRVVDIDFFSLIHKRISDAELDRIQDVTFSVSGAIRTLFNYGTVYIQTAAERPEISFEKVPDPALVTKVLEKLIRMKK